MDEQTKNSSDATQEMAGISHLLASARAGDRSVLPRLQEFLDSRPEIWHRIGDLAEHAREALIDLAGGNDLTAIESMRRKMQQLEAELIGESTSPMVRLLAEQCVLCWAQLHWAELLPIGKDASGAAQGYEVQKRINAIQGRYVQALKTLATVQRFIKPTAVPARPALKLIS